MNTLTIPKTVLAGLITLLAPLASTQAAEITVTYAGSAVFGGSAVGYETGYISTIADPAANAGATIPTTADVYIGGDRSTTTDRSYLFDATGSFNTWCVDIYHWLSSPANYVVETGVELAADLNLVRPIGPSGSQRVAALTDLANEVYGTLSNKQDNAAFQLAVWAITYGSLNNLGNYQVTGTDPNFRVAHDSITSAAVLQGAIDKANGWLNILGTAAYTGNYYMSYLSDNGRQNTQDLVVFTAMPGLISHAGRVPEPTTPALLTLGLIGFGLSRRKSA